VRVGRDFCSLPIGALIATRRSLILQRSADRVPGDYLEERVEQRRQADVHIQNRPLYFLLSLHPRIYRSPRNTFSSHHASIIISSIRSLFSIGSSTRHSLAQRTRRHPRTQLFFLFFIFLFYFILVRPLCRDGDVALGILFRKNVVDRRESRRGRFNETIPVSRRFRGNERFYRILDFLYSYCTIEIFIRYNM